MQKVAKELLTVNNYAAPRSCKLTNPNDPEQLLALLKFKESYLHYAVLCIHINTCV